MKNRSPKARARGAAGVRWRLATMVSALSLLLPACIAQAQAPRGAQSAPQGHAPLDPTRLSAQDRAFVSDLEYRTFRWFWDSADATTGLIPDRFPAPPGNAASIASVGFGLTAYGVGVRRGYITREQAAARTLTTLRVLSRTPQGPAMSGTSGYHGFFYHFLDAKTGLRYADWSELSSIDTALLMSGVLFAESYYTRDTPQEREIRTLAQHLYRRVDWPWMHARGPWLAMGWTPPGQFLPADWKGYNEGLIVYLQALGSPTHPLPASVWNVWTQSYEGQWKSFHGHTLLNFAPLFGHQYSETWVDFRGIHDPWNRAHKNDYFLNSREAVYAQRDYARENPNRWHDYGDDVWGLTACDGPGDATIPVDGEKRHFLAYSARGAGADYVLDDGTIAPTAAGGSIALAPEIALPALRKMRLKYGSKIYTQYGFVDAFNPSFVRDGGTMWADNQGLGIDQGPILLMIENWRSGFVWDVMKHSPELQRGLKRAGFSDGWIADSSVSKDAPTPNPPKLGQGGG